MEVKPIAWSHSRISDLKMCPKLFKAKLDKDVPFEETPEMAEGKRVHKALELRVANGTPLPPQYSKYEKIAASIVNAPGQALTESQMTLTQNLTTTGWFAKDAWVRVQVDVMKINGASAWAGDYKTGKVKLDEHQLDLTAAVMMTQWSEIQTVTASFIWLRDGLLDTRAYTRAQLPTLWNALLVEPARLQEYNLANHWPAKPGYYCSWCPVNGMGKCQSAGKPFKAK